jgi:hypothetical protein
MRSIRPSIWASANVTFNLQIRSNERRRRRRRSRRRRKKERKQPIFPAGCDIKGNQSMPSSRSPYQTLLVNDIGLGLPEGLMELIEFARRELTLRKNKRT